ncbi:hypothetical protein GP486_005549 [Trichoglossum hirsutum]|uniref:Uncharacterized protein n=1 Tax=Trichoglossum hirsutum TaxID=265104 RepID=A0A9P8RMI0_9PEZI|nr:hypothetical protein GP486_005549 [Trichoglossum hirsutum]
MEQDSHNPRDSTLIKRESDDSRSMERHFARLSVGSHSRGGRHSRSLSNCSAYSEGESRFEREDEEEPDEPFFDERFQQALRSGIDLAEEVTNILCACELVTDTSSILHRLWKDATALRGYRNPASRIVGVVGGSGEEFRHRANQFTEPYTIEVEYMNNAEICEQLKELLWSYRQLYIEGTESAASDAEYKTYQSQSELAWHTLEAAFGHREELIPEYLQDGSEGAVNRIYEQLRTWACEIDWPGDGQGKWSSTARTAKECNQKMSVFAGNSLWPFTKVIR